MARTFRRNTKQLIQQVVGSRDEHLRDSWWIMRRYPGCTAEQAYERAVHRYTRDHHPGHYGIPRWFRRIYGSKCLRLRESHALFIHHRNDSWEAHLPDNRCRDASWYWW